MKAFLEAGCEYLFAEVNGTSTLAPTHLDYAYRLSTIYFKRLLYEQNIDSPCQTDNLDDERSFYGNAELPAVRPTGVYEPQFVSRASASQQYGLSIVPDAKQLPSNARRS
eukprot:m.1749 g.1749  ORF g.1749 m.1749 type:complete len:110 (-) comp2543_c0_seq2:82-411(-)